MKPSRYDFRNDYEKWITYARRFHERNLVTGDLYCFTQSFIERKAHRQIAMAEAKRVRTLEIGAGGGEHIFFEKAEDLKDYFTIDVERSFLQILKRQFKVAAILGDAEEIPFQSRSFSTVIASSVLEHISHLEKLLKEIKRILWPEGDFLVTIPRNGSVIIQAYKLLISYPSLRLKGVKRPSFIWNYSNINSCKRIEALLNIHFQVVARHPVGFRHFPSFLAPLIFFHCRNV